MFTLDLGGEELYNEKTMEFYYSDPKISLKLEHSLLSLSKWESIWHKPFLTKEPKTVEETVSYIKCMTITQNVKDDYYKLIQNKDIDAVNNYISDPMTATTFNDPKKPSGSSEVITAEIIYYWMIQLNVPIELEKWHLNRLLALIHVIELKNAPKKKMSKAEIMKRNSELNAKRRAQLNSKG